MQIKSSGYKAGWCAAFIAIDVNVLVSFAMAFVRIGDVQTITFINTAIYTVFALIFALFTERKNLSEGFSQIGFRGFSPKLLPFIILIPLTSQIFCSMMTMPVNGILQLLFGFEMKEDMLVPHGVTETVIAVIYMCVLAPVSEEILFRGVIYKWFERHSTLAAIFLSALTFSLAHLDIRSLIQIFFAGITLGVIRFATGSVIATMISHCAANVFALIMLKLNDSAYNAIVMVMTVLFVFMTILFLRRTKFPPIVRARERRGVSVFMILTLVMFAVFQVFRFAENMYSIIKEHGEFFYDFKTDFNDGFDDDFRKELEREFGIKFD